MEKEKIKFLINNLKAQLIQWNEAYYQHNESLVSDAKFDATMQELIKLENLYPEFKTLDSPTQRVGGHADSGFSKYKHLKPMLSLANAFNNEDLKKFDENVREITGASQIQYVCELKIDGLSISLVYQNYRLMVGATRGDGETGENVTTNIFQIASLPKNIKIANATVRGEVYFKRKNFEQLNQNRYSQNLPLFANPRNAASGTLRQLDSSVINERKLDAFLYYLIEPEQYNVSSQFESLKYLEELGFPVNSTYRLCNGINEVIKYINEYTAQREKLDYEIDGIVIKVNQFKFYDLIGWTTKSPKWAIAYKFPAELATTVIEDIFPSVGRTGKITYNAKLKPVLIAGTMVRAATLHNADFIQKKDLRIGDLVKVKKAGDIIPEVVSVIVNAEHLQRDAWLAADVCPVCNTNLERLPDEVDQYCINSQCSEKILKRIIHFCSRKALNIIGLNERIIVKLYHHDFVKTITDLFSIPSQKEISELTGFGLKSWQNLSISVKNAKTRNGAQLLYGLGIRYVGEKTAQLIMEKYIDINSLLMASISDLEQIPEIGPVVAQSVYDYFKIEQNVIELKNLLALGLNGLYKPKVLTKINLLNQKFVLTGTLSKPRNYFKKIIEDLGGVVIEAVSKNVNYVLVGDNPGSKLAKAEELNLKILLEKDFNDLIS